MYDVATSGPPNQTADLDEPVILRARRLAAGEPNADMDHRRTSSKRAANAAAATNSTGHGAKAWLQSGIDKRSGRMVNLTMAGG